MLLGNGDGTFGTLVNYAVGGAPRAVAASDLNSDGRPDVAVATSTAGILLLTGNGDGTFTPASPVPGAGGASLAVAAADLDGDSRSDLAGVDVGLAGSAATTLPDVKKAGLSSMPCPLGRRWYPDEIWLSVPMPEPPARSRRARSRR